MWPMGISSSTRHGQRCAHIRRVTWPCRLLTALARRESFRPSTVMQNVSCSFCGSTRPRPINCSVEMPSSSRSGPRCSSISPRSKRSWPAGTGVWVVKTVCWATSRRAASKVMPSSFISVRMASSVAKALWPFVQVIHARHDAQGPQRPDAADAGHHFLADAGAIVAAVEPRGQLADLRDCCSARRNPAGRAARGRRASATPWPAAGRCGCRCGR